MITIHVEERNVYGQNLFYCIDENAAALRKLTGRKTLTISDMAALEQLGIHCRMLQNSVPVFQNYRD